ncbi:hypothetical protein [Solidesulfovibrio alcoholivorans]|uniref:hypothetical protein n=1 Tax=Solidesulfovibrio alcoholivorans TaxID=81406 RepID=UPI000497916C|nr:hypothetical protein [Solidesulfovibrio alcoholivorans]
MATYPAVGVGPTRVSDYSFTLPGDVTPFWTRRRSVLAKTTDGTPTTGITVLTSSYNDTTALTTITTTGAALPSPLVSVAPGQIVSNAPLVASDDADDGNCVLLGDGDFVNPILYNQIWG